MQPQSIFLETINWNDYELIDCGGFEKLERFGKYILCRPEPQAIWDKKLPEEEWGRLWNARYIREKGQENQTLTSEKGQWKKKVGMVDRWPIRYEGKTFDFTLNLSLTSFGHIGVFPEQSTNWDFIFEKISEIRKNVKGESAPKVLNLFAYTGASSLAAAGAGAEVVHVDSVKQVVKWAGENKDSSRSNAVVRWLVEDAMKYIKREVRRGSRYHGIILDPPAYGRGPEGEKWLLERDLNDMLHQCEKLLAEKNSFLLLNTYSIGFSPIVLDTLVKSIFKSGKREFGELVLRSRHDHLLPLGSFVRLLRP